MLTKRTVLKYLLGLGVLVPGARVMSHLITQGGRRENLGPVTGGAGHNRSSALLHDMEAERSILGTILVNNNMVEHVPFLRPAQFREPLHGSIFEASLTLIARGLVATPRTLRPFYEWDVGLRRKGGLQYLLDLTRAQKSRDELRQCGYRVRELYLRRRLIEIGEGPGNGARAPDTDPAALKLIERAIRVARNSMTDRAGPTRWNWPHARSSI